MANQPLLWDGADVQGNPLLWDAAGLTWDGSLPQPPKKMAQLRVQLGFTVATDLELLETTDEVILKLYTAPYWTALAAPAPGPNKPPPVTLVALTAARDIFSTAMATAAQGGPADTAAKEVKRNTLIGLLRLLALYVQANCGAQLDNLLASGFDAVSTNRAQSPLAKPVIRDVRSRASGQLTVRIPPLPNARCYEVRFALIGAGGAPGPWQSAGLFTNSQRMEVNGLTPGQSYTFQVRGIGGSTGQSDWSDAVVHMAT